LFVVNGRSVARQIAARPFARFAYHGVAFAAHAAGATGVPACAAVVAASFRQSIALRRDAFAVLLATRLLPHGRLALCTDRRIHAVGDIALRTPMTPTNVIAAAAQLLLEIKPYIELLRDLLQPRGGDDPAPAAAAPA
jgi:hypothetical protein